MALGMNRTFGKLPQDVARIRTLSGNAKVLYSVIARYDECYLSQPKLAVEVGVSERTVRNLVQELVDHGLILVTQRVTKRGHCSQYTRQELPGADPATSSTAPGKSFRSHPAKVAADKEEHDEEEELHGRPDGRPSGSSVVTPGNHIPSHPPVDQESLPMLETLNQPTPITHAASKRKQAEAIEIDFAQWWQEYPRKVAKINAKKAYIKARKSADAHTLLTGLRRALPGWKQREIQYVPHPASWLNGGCWEDEITQPQQRRVEVDCRSMRGGVR